MRSVTIASYCVFIWQLIATAYSFHLRTSPINSYDLTALSLQQVHVFTYPLDNQLDPDERFKLLHVDKNGGFIQIGARNRLITLSAMNSSDQIEATEFIFPLKDVSSINNKHGIQSNNKLHGNFMIGLLPISATSSVNRKSAFNSLLCSTYFGLFKCVQVEQSNGQIRSYNRDVTLKTPNSMNGPLYSRNAYHLVSVQSTQAAAHASSIAEATDYVLYVASSWTDTSQYLAAHSSHYNYQEANVNKKIGFSKSFVKFVEASDRLFLFQNEHSYEVDEGENDRDIMISTSLVSQICKSEEVDENGRAIVGKEAVFYSELTAKIYCFNQAFRKNSANSRNFKFDSLEFISDVIRINDTAQSGGRKLFYGVFNTPKNQITGTAICMFDMNDLAFVFQKANFQYLDKKRENNAKNTPLNPHECAHSSKLTYADKLKYKSFTSKLSYMAKSMLPVRGRRASFIATNDYRIMCVHVVAANHHSNQHTNIMFAGTDNGKLMRLAHHLRAGYFDNEDESEEAVELLDEIQLFDKTTAINEIKMLNNNQLIVIAEKQVRALSADLCEFYADSCERCVHVSRSSRCVWSNNTCRQAISPTPNNHDRVSESSQCAHRHHQLSVSASLAFTSTTAKPAAIAAAKAAVESASTQRFNSTTANSTTNSTDELLMTRVDTPSMISLQEMSDNDNREIAADLGAVGSQSTLAIASGQKSSGLLWRSGTLQAASAAAGSSTSWPVALLVLAVLICLIVLVIGIMIGLILKDRYVNMFVKVLTESGKHKSDGSDKTSVQRMHIARHLKCGGASVPSGDLTLALPSTALDASSSSSNDSFDGSAKDIASDNYCLKSEAASTNYSFVSSSDNHHRCASSSNSSANPGANHVQQQQQTTNNSEKIGQGDKKTVEYFTVQNDYFILPRNASSSTKTNTTTTNNNNMINKAGLMVTSPASSIDSSSSTSGGGGGANGLLHLMNSHANLILTRGINVSNTAGGIHPNRFTSTRMSHLNVMTTTTTTTSATMAKRRPVPSYQEALAVSRERSSQSSSTSSSSSSAANTPTRRDQVVADAERTSSPSQPAACWQLARSNNDATKQVVIVDEIVANYRQMTNHHQSVLNNNVSTNSSASPTSESASSGSSTTNERKKTKKKRTNGQGAVELPTRPATASVQSTAGEMLSPMDVNFLSSLNHHTIDPNSVVVYDGGVVAGPLLPLNNSYF